MLLQENTVVAGKYRLVKMVGRGGMGSVWHAQQLGLNAPCAIKFIEGELNNVAEAHARFQREAEAAAKLRGNKHVVQVYDHGVWESMPYIAMELLDGHDLGKEISLAPDHRLSPTEVVRIMKQVCKVLGKAHASGIVHRDMKPDNIYLCVDEEDDQRKIAKILDFGVAKSTSQALDGSNTKTGAMLGTPYYMSPEQAQGIKSIDSRSDLWSLAVIVFQCVTGRLPFESEALGDLLVKIIVSPIPTPSEYYPGVPAGFDTWWRKASDRNPDNRFPTAKEFAESLAMALGQSSITDVTQTRRDALQKLGGGTAMMVQPPTATKSNPPGNMQTAALGSTPNPAGQQSGGHAPFMQTPPGAQGPIITPQGMTPITNPNLSTNAAMVNDQPIDLPAKKPPLGVMIGAIAGFLVVGGIGITLALSAKSKAANASGDPTTSASVAAEHPSASTAVAKNADPPPTPTNEPATEPPAASSVASAAPPAKPETPPTPPAGGQHVGGQVAIGGGAAKPPVTPPPVKPTTQPAGGTTKPAGTKPPKGDLGF